MVTKLGQFTMLGHLSFLKCPNFVNIFCQVLKMEIIFFDIPSNTLPIAVRNSLTNHFFQKIDDFVYFQQKKKFKTEEKRREDHQISPSITKDHPRSPKNIQDHPRSPKITKDQSITPNITQHHPRSPSITPNLPKITHDHSR